MPASLATAAAATSEVTSMLPCPRPRGPMPAPEGPRWLPPKGPSFTSVSMAVPHKVSSRRCFCFSSEREGNSSGFRSPEYGACQAGSFPSLSTCRRGGKPVEFRRHCATSVFRLVGGCAGPLISPLPLPRRHLRVVCVQTFDLTCRAGASSTGLIREGVSAAHRPLSRAGWRALPCTRFDPALPSFRSLFAAEMNLFL